MRQEAEKESKIVGGERPPGVGLWEWLPRDLKQTYRGFKRGLLAMDRLYNDFVSREPRCGRRNGFITRLLQRHRACVVCKTSV